VLKALGTAACGSGPAEIAATSSKPRKAWKGAESLDFTRYRSRFVALHIMYLGHNYHGLASQASAADTIEVW
jgi:tRNA pseudouridine38/39 synthase